MLLAFTCERLTVRVCLRKALNSPLTLLMPDSRDHLRPLLQARPRVAASVAVLGLALLTAVIYWPGLDGPLLLDDFWNLQPLADGNGVDTLAEARQFVFGNDSGPMGRPVAMASLLLDARSWPPDVQALKTTNLVLHLLCGLVLACVIHNLANALQADKTRAAILATVVSGIWLLNPLNLSTTLYVIQRMTQLMTLFSLLAILCYLAGRQAMVRGEQGKSLALLIASLVPFGLLSVLSKENGALLLLVILLIEWLVFEFRAHRRWYRLWLYAGVVLPLIVAALYLVWTLPETLGQYASRPFSVSERLLTECRVLFSYVWKMLVPGFGAGHLYFDDWQVSESLWSPLTTLLSALALAAAVCCAVLWRRKYKVLSLGILWFLALHLLESTYLPLELVFEHRNYLAMVGPLFALAWYGYILLQQTLTPFRLRTLIFLVLAYTLSLAVNTAVLARNWSDPLVLHSTWARQQPQSVRAQLTYASYLDAVGDHDGASRHLELARQISPNEITVLLAGWLHACETQSQPPVSLQQMADNPRLEHYHNDINTSLRQLLEAMVAGTCEFPDGSVLVSLFDRIGDLPLTDRKRAGYHIYFSDVYASMGLLDPALIQVSRAFQINPNPRFPLRQALMSASAGRFADALIFLERARVADAARNPALPSIAEQLDTLEQDFRARI